jgi:argininosuccinate lyase
MTGTDREQQPTREAYRREVLGPLFRDLKGELVGELLEATRAHLVVLHDNRMLGASQVASLLRAIEALARADPAALAYDPEVEDLSFALERDLAGHVGAEMAGSIQLARSRNDLDGAAYRMVVRRKLLDLAEAQAGTAAALLARARDGGGTLVVARTHGAPAQPTTLGHILWAYLEVVRRDQGRARAAYATVNRSPLGACALAGTGFPLDREGLAAWAGFDALVENTYDAVASADHILEAGAAAAVGLAQAARFLETLRLWASAPRPPLRLDPGLIQISSMMPQKRNAVFVEHLRARAAHAAGALAGGLASVAAAPFEDSDQAATDLQATAWAVLDQAAGTYRVLGLALRTAAIGEGAPPEEVVASGATASELMDTLVRRFGLPQRTAHHVVSALVDRASDPRVWTGELVREVAREVTGRDLVMRTEEVRRALDPAAFIDGRSTRGGPSGAALARGLAEAQGAVRDHEAWLAGARARLAAAHDGLSARCAVLASSRGR